MIVDFYGRLEHGQDVSHSVQKLRHFLRDMTLKVTVFK